MNRKQITWLLGAVVAALLLANVGVATFEAVRDNRQGVRDRADWLAQRAKLEQALRSVSAPGDWVALTCPASVLTSMNRCWSGQRGLPASYEVEAVAALKSAVVADVRWQCDRVAQPRILPGPSCDAIAVIGGRGIVVTVSSRFDEAASRARRKATFDGVEIRLGADLSPPY